MVSTLHKGFINTGSRKKTTRVIIFNCTKGRSGSTFLGSMLERAASQLKIHYPGETTATLFDHAIFCTNVTYADGHFKGGMDIHTSPPAFTDLAYKDLTTHAIPTSDLEQLKTQQELASAWSALIPSFPTSSVHVLPSIEHAIDVVRSLKSGPVDVLVTGSLHLVGGVIEVAGLTGVAL